MNTSAEYIPVSKEHHYNQAVIKGLIYCGIISSLLYIAADIIAAAQWKEYDYSSQAISELAAFEAPTRPFMTGAFLIYNILVIAFSAGVLSSGGKKLSVRLAGIVIFLYAVDGLLGFLLYPMHSRGAMAGGMPDDIMHIYITAAEVLFLLLSMVFGAFADGKWFKVYSFITIPVVLLFGLWVGLDIPNIAANLPTPWHGIKERVNIYGYMIWLMMFAVILLRQEKMRLHFKD